MYYENVGVRAAGRGVPSYAMVASFPPEKQPKLISGSSILLHAYYFFIMLRIDFLCKTDESC